MPACAHVAAALVDTAELEGELVGCAGMEEGAVALLLSIVDHGRNGEPLYRVPCACGCGAAQIRVALGKVGRVGSVDCGQGVCEGRRAN